MILENIEKKFDIPVLKDVSMTLDKGSIVGLIGPNGSGKTTLLRMMSGIMKPDHGQVIVDNQILFDNEKQKQKVFFVNDDPYFFPHVTPLSLESFYEDFYPTFDHIFYHDLLELFRLPKNKAIKSFSKGMKRQIMLCIGLALKPEYLLLDEAFDGLDPLMRYEFKKYLVQIIVDKKMTIIISSHNLRELEDICDTFFMIHNGFVLESGKLEDMKKQIFKIQCAFEDIHSKEDFKDLNILSFKNTSRVIQMVIKGDMKKTQEALEQYHPLMQEFLPLNLEEIFIYELQKDKEIIHEKVSL